MNTIANAFPQKSLSSLFVLCETNNYSPLTVTNGLFVIVWGMGCWQHDRASSEVLKKLVEMKKAFIFPTQVSGFATGTALLSLGN